jgi:hypothetical protein
MWRRCVAADGRLYFQNGASHTTAWALPTWTACDVVWPVPSPLGLHIETEDAPGRPGFKICVLRGASRALLRMLRGCVQCEARYPPVFFSSIPSSCIEPPNHAVSTPTMMV